MTYTAGVEIHVPNQSTKPETMLNEHVADYPLQANGTAVTSNILSLHFSQCNESRIECSTMNITGYGQPNLWLCVIYLIKPFLRGPKLINLKGASFCLQTSGLFRNLPDEVFA
jgi:hypothetical protein